MPRCFLHQVRRGERYESSEGEVFSDVRAAFSAAIRAAREINAEGGVSDEDLRHARVDIVGEAGQTLLSLPFESAICEAPSWTDLNAVASFAR